MARNPKKKRAKKPARKPTRRAPTNRNTNTVRVHVNLDGGSSAPPPYTGPDRGYFAFNPVFDVGGPKQAAEPPMNTGQNISSGPIKRVTETGTQLNGGVDISAAMLRDDMSQTSRGMTRSDLYATLRARGITKISDKTKRELEELYAIVMERS